MAKDIQVKTWTLPASGGTRYSIGRKPPTWSLPDPINLENSDTLGIRQYVNDDVASDTLDVTGLATGLSYNSGTEEIEASAGDDPASSTATFTINGLTEATTTVALVEADDFQLAAGHYEDSHITAEIIAPRPDVERSTGSRYSYAYPGLEYEVPIVVLGGSYPFKYEITASSGTANVAGATIGETRSYSVGREWYGSANMKDYGILRWTPDAGDDGNTFSFTVKVTGQDGTTAERTFTGDVQTSKFIFVDLDVASSGDGTKDTPYKDTDDGWWDDGNHGGKFVYYRGRAGTYAAFPTSTWKSTKPRVHMRYPGDSRYNWDGTVKDYLFESAGMDDVWVSGLYVEQGPGTDVAEARFFESGTSVSSYDRPMYWDNYFFDGRVGSTGGSNNGWLVIMDSGVVKSYMSIVGNTFDTANWSSNGFNATNFYQVEKYVVEHNIIKNWGGDFGFYQKQDGRNYSIRANDCWENNASDRNVISAGISFEDYPSTNWEICWNWAKGSGSSPVGTQGGVAASLDADHSPRYIFRNTMYAVNKVACTQVFETTDQREVVETVKNVMVSEQNPHSIRGPDGPIDTSGSTDAEAEEFLPNSTFNNQWYDTDTQTEVNATSGLLQNDGTSLLGTHGAEIE